MNHSTWTDKALQLRNRLQGLPQDERRGVFMQLPENVRRKALTSPYILGRNKQIEALTSDADTILVLCGRGWGKNWTLSHWILDRIERGHKATAAVAETAADVRDDVVDPAEENSGILDFAEARELSPTHKISQSRVELRAPHGEARIQLYSGDSPDSLRGFSGSALVIDELAKYRYPRQVWNQANLSLREGSDDIGSSQVLITTTPRPIPLIKEIAEDPDVHVITGSSWENENNLDERFIRRLERLENTDRGRQEVYAEILEAGGDLWDYDDIRHCTPDEVPTLVRIVIGLDPSVSNDEGDEAGIVVCGLGADDNAYVLEDLSGQYTTREWGAVAVAAFWGDLARLSDYLDDTSSVPSREYDWPPADKIEAERNQGGALVENQIRSISERVAYDSVHAVHSKKVRAEPIHSLYQAGEVFHVGTHSDLEDQMTDFLQDNSDEDDRVDALVHSLTELLLPESRSPVTSDPVIGLD